jgi:hypothetical protein
MTGNVSTNVLLTLDRLTIVSIEKTIIITYSEYVPVALGTQHAMRIRRVTSSSAVSLALP